MLKLKELLMRDLYNTADAFGPNDYNLKVFTRWLHSSGVDSMYNNWIKNGRTTINSVCISQINDANDNQLGNLRISSLRDKHVIIEQHDDNGIIKTHNSLHSVETTTGIKANLVLMACAGLTKRVNGYKWVCHEL